jgi:flagellar biogenesis protein FliO
MRNAMKSGWLQRCCATFLLCIALIPSSEAISTAPLPPSADQQTKAPPTGKPVEASPKEAALKTTNVAPPASKADLSAKSGLDKLKQLSKEMQKANPRPSSPVTTGAAASAPAETQNMKPVQPERQPVSSALRGHDEEDTENLPLTFDSEQQSAVAHASSGLMMRMVLSLLAVLALFFACIKWLLPGLMARYPALFARQQTGETPFKKGNFTERVNSRFNIITSAPLGKDRELHLVEIQGRQLVIATTPYTVTLIKELTEPASSAAELNTLLAGLQEAPTPGDGWLRVDDTPLSKNSRLESYHSPRRGLAKSRLKPERHSELPNSRKIKPKPLAAKMPIPEEFEEDVVTKPSQSSRLYQETPPYKPTSDLLHLKYLHSESGEHEFLKKDSLRSLYREPEDDVVLLDDYDDVYEGSPRQ